MHAVVLAALLLISAPWRLDVILERGHILVGMTGDYRPFSNLREDGTFEGLDVEAALSLAGALGVDVRFVKTSWPTLVQGILEGRYDIAMSGVTRTLERQKVVGLSNGYLSIGKCPLIRASDQDRLTGLETIDRPGIRIGVNPGGTNESFVRAQISKAEIIVFENNLAIPEAVATGRVDVMITDNVEAVLAARRDPRLHAVAPDRPLTREELSDMIPRDDPVFLNWINL